MSAQQSAEPRDELDVVLIGNGAVACAIALRFVAEYPEARVAIVGPRARTGAASLAAGAMLGVFGELGEGSLDAEPSRLKFEAALAATELWPAHLELLNARLVETPPVRIRQGTYIVSRSEAEDEADDEIQAEATAPAPALDPDPDFHAVLTALAHYRAPFSEVDPRSIPDLAAASPRHLPRRAVFVPGEGAIATRHLHRAYDEAFARSPAVTVFDDEAVAVRPSGSTTVVELASARRLCARHVVLAAGAATQRLVDDLQLAARVPRLVHGVGVALILDSPVALPPHVVRTPNRGLAGGLYSVPYPAPFAYVGASSTMSLVAANAATTETTRAAIYRLLHAATRHLHHGLAEAAIHKILVGSRPTPLDTYPLFGQTSLPGVWLATGTKRDGLHLSPKLAVELTRAIANGDAPLGGHFLPERPLLLPRAPRPDAIARATALRLRATRALARTGGHARAPLLDDVAAIYQRCTARGLITADQQIPVELLELYAALAAQLAV